MKTALQLVTLVTLVTLAALPALFAQGPLAPPGAPAPTMKTLDQVEPRTPLNDTAVPGDASYHHIITTPGSYYLAGNLVVNKTNGIQVTAAGVTLDLNGFSIRRGSGTGGDAITIGSLAHRCTVKNGTIGAGAGGLGFPFANGVYALDTNFPIVPRGGTFLQLAVSGCSIAALRAGQSWEITGCEVHDNVGGISGGIGSTITRCTASATSLGSGISAQNSTIRDCTAYENDRDGISGGYGSIITGCTAERNGDDGIVASGESTIAGCLANGNTGDGIDVDYACFVQGNTCSRNGSDGDGAGIHATGAGNRIEGNLVYQNDRGIDVDVGGNLIIKNSASGNVISYALAVNNKVGVIVLAPNSAAISGNTGGAGVGTRSTRSADFVASSHFQPALANTVRKA